MNGKIYILDGRMASSRIYYAVLRGKMDGLNSQSVYSPKNVFVCMAIFQLYSDAI